MAWTFVDSDGYGASASSTTIATPGVTVAAGDLAVVLVSYEGTATTLSVSDGTSSLTEWVVGQKYASLTLDVFYILASVASGTNSVVYTATFGGGGGAYRNIAVMVFTPPSAASLDGTAVAASGTSTALASGNITTTGTNGIAFGAYAEYGEDLNTEKINGVTLERKQIATGLRSELWQIAYSAGFTGQATAVLTSDPWIGGVIAFKAGAGGFIVGPFPTFRPDLP